MRRKNNSFFISVLFINFFLLTVGISVGPPFFSKFLGYYYLNKAIKENVWFDEYTQKGKIYLQKSTNYDPSEKFPHILLGDIYLAENNFSNAINEFSIVLDLDSENTYAKQKLGEIYFQLDHYNKSLEYYENLQNP